MAERPEFQRKQLAFAAHIRDPDNNPAPDGIEDRRMEIYRDLFFNNLLKLLSGMFPVLRKLHSREKWQALIRGFMAVHRAETPYFLRIAEEFRRFLETEYEADENDYPFLAELAHYEWAELDVSVAEAGNDDLALDDDVDLLSGIPVKSNVASLYAYRYPVHRISSNYIPDAPCEHPTYLVIFRKHDDNVGFMELNPVTARLLQRIEENDSLSGRALLDEIAEEIAYPDRDAFVAHGHAAMQEMLDAEILAGVRRSG